MRRKRFVLLLLMVLFLTPLAAQEKENPRPWLATALEAISPVTHDRDGKVDWVFTGILTTMDVMSAMDLVTSRYAVDHGAREVNPIMRWGSEHRPLDIALKLASIAGANYLFKLGYENEDGSNGKLMGYIVAGTAAAAMSWVVYHNYRVTMQLTL